MSGQVGAETHNDGSITETTSFEFQGGGESLWEKTRPKATQQRGGGGKTPKWIFSMVERGRHKRSKQIAGRFWGVFRGRTTVWKKGEGSQLLGYPRAGWGGPHRRIESRKTNHAPPTPPPVGGPGRLVRARGGGANTAFRPHDLRQVRQGDAHGRRKKGGGEDKVRQITHQ